MNTYLNRGCRNAGKVIDGEVAEWMGLSRHYLREKEQGQSGER
jgi:hypothetical protein